MLFAGRIYEMATKTISRGWYVINDKWWMRMDDDEGTNTSPIYPLTFASVIFRLSRGWWGPCFLAFLESIWWIMDAERDNLNPGIGHWVNTSAAILGPKSTLSVGSLVTAGPFLRIKQHPTNSACNKLTILSTHIYPVANVPVTTRILTCF